MRKIRKVKGKSPDTPDDPQPWDPQQVIQRINRARGDYLRRTGEDRSWPDFARTLKWRPSTQTDVKSGKRPLRVSELGRIAQRLDVRAGYLAFGEEPIRHNGDPETFPREVRILPDDQRDARRSDEQAG